MILFAPVLVGLGFFAECLGGAAFGLVGGLFGEVLCWVAGEAAGLVCEATFEGFGEAVGGQVGDALARVAGECLEDELRS